MLCEVGTELLSVHTSGLYVEGMIHFRHQVHRLMNTLMVPRRLGHVVMLMICHRKVGLLSSNLGRDIDNPE
jgi:hypothetical protein